jgi:hypothetical protein
MVSPSFCVVFPSKNNQKPQRKYQKQSKALKNHPNPSSRCRNPSKTSETVKKLTELQ